VPATADALTALSQQLTHATGQLQRAAGQLSACTGIAERARGAIDQVSTSVAKATDTAHWAVAEITYQWRVAGIWAVSLLCGAAWLLGMLGGIVFERWRSRGVALVPQAIAVPAQLAAPSSAAESTPKKPMHETPRPRRESHAPIGRASERCFHATNGEIVRCVCVVHTQEVVDGHDRIDRLSLAPVSPRVVAVEDSHGHARTAPIQLHAIPHEAGHEPGEPAQQLERGVEHSGNIER
jgi:hypothetical protein